MPSSDALLLCVWLGALFSIASSSRLSTTLRTGRREGMPRPGQRSYEDGASRSLRSAQAAGFYREIIHDIFQSVYVANQAQS